MDDEKIKQMVTRFLVWKLPEDFNPDGGVIFTKRINGHTYEPVGTNLLSYPQAEEMVRYMLDETPPTLGINVGEETNTQDRFGR